VALNLSLIIYHCSLVAQQHKADSLYKVVRSEKEDTVKVNTLADITTALESSASYRAADSVARLGLALSQKIKFKKGIAKAYKNLGAINLDQEKYTEALKDYMMCLDIAEQIHDKNMMASGYGKVGIIYGNEGNFPEALKYQLKNLNVREEQGDKLSIDITCENIGNIYCKLGNYKEALTYQERCLSIAKEINDVQGMGYVYGDLGSIYYALHKYDESLRNQLKSLEICKKLADKQGMGNAYVNVGNVYQVQKKNEDALQYFFQGLQAYREIGSKYYEDYAYVCIGSDFYDEKNYARSQIYLDSAINTAIIIGEKEIEKEAYFERAKLDSAKDNFKQSLEDFKKSVQFGDSLKNEENTKKIVSEQMQYEFDKKQTADRAEQEKKDAITSADNHKQQIIIGSVTVGLLLVLVFSGLLFSRFRITQRQKTVIEKQKQVVEEQKLLVEHQKAIVDEKNKDITDSIHYASRIQRALLTTDDYIGKRLKEYFILFKPRDIVSGDFYWANEVETDAGKRLLVCAGDCTGHGVPGAFMSLLNISILNEVNIEKKINEPAKILNEVRDHIIKALNPEGKDEGSKDGMDCVLASLAPSSPEGGIILTYAAAYNAPLVIKKSPPSECNSEAVEAELPCDKMPVGIFIGEKKPFTQHSVEMNSGDCLYLFTDGYADQFGGPKGKKFKYKTLSEKLKTISEKPMAEQKQILEGTFEEWKGNLEQVDDVLIIGIRV